MRYVPRRFSYTDSVRVEVPVAHVQKRPKSPSKVRCRRARLDRRNQKREIYSRRRLAGKGVLVEGKLKGLGPSDL